MKKMLSMILCVALMLSVLSFISCGKAELSLGLGVYTTASSADATEDKNGSGKATVTAAAVLVDANGKIVKCFVDCMDNQVAYTADGKALATESFKSKYELGDAYGMTAYGGATKEWYEQVDAFTALVVGKTLDEVKAMVVSDDEGNNGVISAGCTIDVDEFVKAIEKAVENAAPSAATAKDTLKLGMSTSQTLSDATEDKPGKNQVETTCVAVATDAEGKITAAMSDCVQVAFTFTANGASSFVATSDISTKRDNGDGYGMKAYGGAAKEWYEQANAFDAACIGKTIGDVESLLGENNYGTTDLQAAGCTILVDGFVKAASKIG